MRTTVSETMDKMNEQGVLQYAIDWLRDGKWNRLSQEEEDTIINISKKF